MTDKVSAAGVLVELALGRFVFGSSTDGRTFGVEERSHVVRPLRGGKRSVRGELARDYRKATGKVPPAQALTDALVVLEAEGEDAEAVEVALRVAKQEGVVYIDLGDRTNRVIRIDGDGWSIANSSPMLFRRTALTGSFPLPVEGGGLDEFWELVNVPEEDEPLVLAWLVAAIISPEIAHPILWLLGEQGTAKSTLLRLLMRLFDPSPVEVRQPPTDKDSFVLIVAGSYGVGIDNASKISDGLSDSLCRAATGEGDVRRQLYSDDDLRVFAYRRVFALNGIDVGAIAQDLADRAIVIRLERITPERRRTEAELDGLWRLAYPRILGALLDEAVRVLHVLPEVHLPLSPRMADFAHIVAALDLTNGTNGLRRFTGQAAGLAADSLNSDPFLNAVMGVEGGFMGTSAELLDIVTPSVRPFGWPNPRQVTGKLRRNAPALRAVGWLVEESRDAHTKVTVWSITKEGKTNPCPQDPQDPHTAGDAGYAGGARAPSLQARSPAKCVECGRAVAPGRTAAGLDKCSYCDERKVV